jgi:hypothetical protein
MPILFESENEQREGSEQLFRAVRLVALSAILSLMSIAYRAAEAALGSGLMHHSKYAHHTFCRG